MAAPAKTKTHTKSSAKRHAQPDAASVVKKQKTTGGRPLGEATLQFQRATVVAAVERSSRQISLKLGVDTILSKAQVIELTEDGTSWVYHVPKWYRHIYDFHQDQNREYATLAYDDWFDAVWNLHPKECGTIKLFGKEIRTPRFQQAYGVTHRFSGATFAAKPFPDILQQAVSVVQSMLVEPGTGQTCLEAGLLNWYADGNHYMGPHSDEGVSIHAGSPIFSLTLGPASRRFLFTPRGSAAGKRRVEMVLDDGDLVIMGGTTQKTHKHALPKMKKCRERRVNVTLRYFK